jgi:DNA repair protein RecN (Recombination protein N)
VIELLRVRDFALVEALDLEFSPGFTVLTGETGAGKSILLKALGLLLGDRASRDDVRAGADVARVEGLFQPSAGARDALGAVLEAAGVSWEAGEGLLLARVVAADGRSRAYVNGALAPLSLLARLGEQLVEVSSQHQHQGLLREETHLQVLDESLDAEGTAERQSCAAAFLSWRRAVGEVDRLQDLAEQARERAESVRSQVEEIRAAGLEAGEEDRLRGEREVLLHAEKLLDAYGRAEEDLYSGADAALDRLARAARGVEEAARRDPEAQAILGLLSDGKAVLEEAALRVRERRAGLQADPGRLDAVEARLEQIRRLERKHGPGTEAILARLETLERELWEVENTDLALESARAAETAGAAVLEEQCRGLRAARERAAERMQTLVGRELEAFALGRSSFRVVLEPTQPGPSGSDAVRFLLAANPGEPALPLARVASGGELSRVLLALKNALRDTRVETLIFDEVDAGIGGAVADAVGDRLSTLARACQVLCVTHLPQIACRAGNHLRVEKVAEGGRTVARVRPLDRADRVEELARMMGGLRVTETTRRHAREMVEAFAS